MSNSKGEALVRNSVGFLLDCRSQYHLAFIFRTSNHRQRSELLHLTVTMLALISSMAPNMSLVWCTLPPSKLYGIQSVINKVLTLFFKGSLYLFCYLKCGCFRILPPPLQSSQVVAVLPQSTHHRFWMRGRCTHCSTPPLSDHSFFRFKTLASLKHVTWDYATCYPCYSHPLAHLSIIPSHPLAILALAHCLLLHYCFSLPF